MKYRGEAESAQRDTEQLLAPADQGEDGMQEAEGVQGGGHAKPDDAHFSHERSRNL